MPTLRKRSRTLETPANPNHHQMINNGDQTQTTETKKTISGYEESREKRIKENLERMQKLGILDLSLKLKSFTPPKVTPKNSSATKTPHRPSPLPPLVPTRRSSRLQNVTPVSYSEMDVLKKRSSFKDEDVLVEKGSKPEVYTEEHEKLLGDSKMSWTLFVDGVGEDGKRIYDSVKGKTCHQCRQKTLGHRTHCSQCNMVQGQFCGDCLYMRYGEHVLEAKQNPNWICPVCRGICNCSLCRQAKGWPPTGTLFRKIESLGFKSVAHYLIQTRRSETNLGNDQGTKTPVSAKRSLPFSDMEAPSERKESPKVDDDQLGLLKYQSEDKRDDELKGEKGKEFHLDNKNGNHNIALESSPKPKKKPASATEPSPDSISGRLRQRRNKDNSCDGEELTKVNEVIPMINDDQLGLLKPQSEDKQDDELKGKKGKELHLDNKNGDCNIALESSPKPKKKHASTSEPSPDSIAGRLRQRRNKDNSGDGEELAKVNEETLDVKQAINNISSESTAKFNTDLSIPTEPSPGSIAGRLRSRRTIA